MNGLNASNATKEAVAFQQWAQMVRNLLERTSETVSDYELKPYYRDGFTPKATVKDLLGY